MTLKNVNMWVYNTGTWMWIKYACNTNVREWRVGSLQYYPFPVLFWCISYFTFNICDIIIGEERKGRIELSVNLISYTNYQISLWFISQLEIGYCSKESWLLDLILWKYYFSFFFRYNSLNLWEYLETSNVGQLRTLKGSDSRGQN